MKTKALRQYGKYDLRFEEFELPPVGDEELLVKVVSDSICMSTYKAYIQGADHKRVPDDIAENPVIIGHEFGGEILEVGAKLKGSGKYAAGRRFSIQPAMKGTYDAAGYSFKYLGGNTQYAIIPKCYIDQDCVLPFGGDTWFHASMSEPVSCVIGAAHANYHTVAGEYTHAMGIREGGNLAALAAAGPMGLALIDYLMHCDRRPSLLIVTDIDEKRLARARAIFTPQEAERCGVRFEFVNTGKMDKPADELRAITDGRGYDDVFVFAPVAPVVEQAGALLAYDGCMNFFAGPSDQGFSAMFNFYNVHYNATHLVGTSGGNTDDMKEALDLAASGRINPSILITHIGGLDAARDTTSRLPEIPGGKKLIYTHISMPLTAIDDFRALGDADPLFAALADICERHGGLWNGEAESYLLANGKAI